MEVVNCPEFVTRCTYCGEARSGNLSCCGEVHFEEVPECPECHGELDARTSEVTGIETTVFHCTECKWVSDPE